MGRVLLCLGRYARNPYFVERAYVNVYSVEELCYCLIRNAYLVDEEIMDENLPDWLERECGLKNLDVTMGSIFSPVGGESSPA